MQACPPSAGYLLRKFAWRNKRSLFTGTILSGAVLIAAGSVGWGMCDRSARRAETAQQASESLARARFWIAENKLALVPQELAEVKAELTPTAQNYQAA